MHFSNYSHIGKLDKGLFIRSSLEFNRIVFLHRISYFDGNALRTIGGQHPIEGSQVTNDSVRVYKGQQSSLVYQ